MVLGVSEPTLSFYTRGVHFAWAWGRWEFAVRTMLQHSCLAFFFPRRDNGLRRFSIFLWGRRDDTSSFFACATIFTIDERLGRAWGSKRETTILFESTEMAGR